MPPPSSLRAWLALSLTKGLGGEGIRRLLRELGPPEAVFAASSASLCTIVKPAVAAQITEGVDDALITPALDWLEDSNNHIVTIDDPDYPQTLLNIPDPPVLLYVKGRIEFLNHPGIAIVGSRNPTPQGIQNAESFSRSLSNAGLCIVSGMALGIDAAAHRGAMRENGASIAVTGTGLDRVYPASNRSLAHELAQHGALISEFPLGTPPLPTHFPRRNRIISGLSAGVLVVEASVQSGSLITARMALEQGRDVFAIPGSIHSPQSKGCHNLIKQGAKLVETAQDIIDELNFSTLLPVDPSSLAPPDIPLLSVLGFDPVDIDTLSARSGLTMAELSAMLLSLELEGRISHLPGGRYQRII